LSDESRYSVSPLQEGLLVESLRSPESDPNVVQHFLSITGPRVEPGALSAAWRNLARRHDTLRTRFDLGGVGGPSQIVDDGAVPDARVLVHVSESRLMELAEVERRRGFQLQVAPLARVLLIPVASTQCLALLTFHHAVLDGWSAQLLLEDWAQEYVSIATRAGHTESATPQFRSYVEWLATQQDSHSAELWRRMLDDRSQSLLFGLTGSSKNGATGEVVVEMAADDAARLASSARLQRVTAASIFQGAVAVWLSVATGRNPVRFGMTISTRPAELRGAEKMVGLMANTIPLPVHVEATESIERWLRTIQASGAALRAVGHHPLSQIRRWAALDAGQPLFDVHLVVQNYPLSGRSVGSTALSIARLRSLVPAQLPLSIIVEPNPMTIRLRYKTDCLTDDDARRVAQQLVETTCALVRNPAAPVREIVDVAAGRGRKLGLALQQEALQQEAPTAGMAPGTSSERRHASDSPAQDPDSLTAAIGATWADALGVQVGPSDDFFVLGGDSLLAMRIIARLAAVGFPDIPLALLFDHPVLEDFIEEAARMVVAS
jgi:hypothetical protein